MIRKIALSTLGLLLFQKSYRQIKSFLFSYRGKVVVLSGGSRGLGLVMARKLVQQGARVALLARDLRALQEASKEFHDSELLIISCDVGRSTDVKAAIDEVNSHFGQIDILIHNAGVIQVGARENQAVKDYKQSLRTHFWGAYYLLENCLPQLKQSHDPRVLIVDSVAGLFGIPHLAAYTTGKAALAGYIESIQAELKEEGVPISLAYPGLLRTGSPYQAIYKGEAFLERRWFTILDSLPGLSVSADYAATTLLQALAEKRSVVVVGLVAKLGAIASRLVPNLFSGVIGQMLWLQPHAGQGKQGQKGTDLEADESLEKAAVLTNLAALRNNEI